MKAPIRQRPNEYAELTLLRGFLEGTYPPGSALPSERTLAGKLGVTRPTLREALRRLERDGWISIRQGKPTIVNDFWAQGGLNVLGQLTRHSDQMPPDFIHNLLEVRLALAPAFTRAAVKRAPSKVMAHLEQAERLEDSAEAMAAYDWELHVLLTVECGNPVFRLILNGFKDVWSLLAPLYFSEPPARTASRQFYAALKARAEANDPAGAERLTRAVMRDSIRFWARASRGEGVAA